MNIGSARMAVFAAFLLIVCFANESLASRREGTIGWFATVHRDADMDYKSIVGAYSVVAAKAHLYRRSQIAEHVRVEEGASLYRKAIVLSHSLIRSGAEIGNATTCEQFTNVGRNAVIGDNSLMKRHSAVGSYSRVGSNCVIGHYSYVGRRVLMEEGASTGVHARIGCESKLGKNSVVQNYVVVPHAMRIMANQVVISAPETTILLRMLTGRVFSRRFYQEVDELSSKSDSSFGRAFDDQLGYILSDLNKNCKRSIELSPRVKFLAYAYLQKMLGDSKMDSLVRPKDQVIIVQNGEMLGEVNDCGNEKRYDRILDPKTQEKFLVLMAIYDDYHRQARVEDQSTCAIIKDLLAGKRSVLAINEKCGGSKVYTCNGCGGGDESPDASYKVNENDVTLYY